MRHLSTLIPGLFLLLCICLFSSCSDDDTVALVRFSFPEVEVMTDTLTPSSISLELTPAATETSNVRIIAPQNAYGSLFITEPPLSAGEINVPVSSGATSASFELILLEEGIGFEDFQQDFEIIAVGPGLTTNEFEGRYLSFNLINEHVQEDDLPFVENFNICTSGSAEEFPPEGWENRIVEQNSFGTGGFFCYTGQGITGVGTNPFLDDGIATQGDDYSEAWLISPPISLGGAEAPGLSFDFDRRFDAPIDENTLEYGLQISTDYDGTNFETANWEDFQPAVDAMTANDPGFDGIENTGTLDLSAYEGQDISIAFIHRAADAFFLATSIRVANVRVE